MKNLTYTSDSRGYMLFYNGNPIGGARTMPSSGEGYRRRSHKGIMADVAMFAEDAKREIAELQAGCGQKRFRDAMKDIDEQTHPAAQHTEGFPLLDRYKQS